MAIGGVVHKTLAKVLGLRRDGRPVTTLETYAVPYLQKERYPPENGDELRAEHLPEIIDHLECALSLIPADSEVLEIEEYFKFPFRLNAIEHDLNLLSRVDLIIRHGDTGTVDHIDFKTGFTGGSQLQNIVARLTVAHDLDLRGEQLRTVNILTQSREYQVWPVAPDDVSKTWAVIKDTIGNIALDTAWQARPDPWVCQRCDFRPVCDKAVASPDSDEFDS
jgi:hypothetical protein